MIIKKLVHVLIIFLLVFNTFSLNTPWTGWSLSGVAHATSSGEGEGFFNKPT